MAHRRQVAQEGLSDTDRSWSYAGDSQQGAEIATVPEEIAVDGGRTLHQ